MKKYIIAIVLFFIIIGFVIGINNEVDLSNVVMLKFSYKYLINTLLICLCGIMLSYIGIPLFFIIIIFDLIACGLVTSYLWQAFNFQGLLFSIIFFLAFKLIYWFLLSLNGFYSIKLIKNNFKYLLRRFRENKNNSKLYFKKICIITSLIITFNLFFVLLGNKLIIPLASYLLF
ncbi:MAG: hypothetical protein E7167_04465 [Firmicutes bacterium]|nr:hypothetical protein [Bacillota bacterium]